MLGYEVLGSRACDWYTPHSTIASATAPSAFIRRIFRLIASFEVLDMMSSPLYETSPPTAFTCCGSAPLSTREPLPDRRNEQHVSQVPSIGVSNGGCPNRQPRREIFIIGDPADVAE